MSESILVANFLHCFSTYHILPYVIKVFLEWQNHEFVKFQSCEATSLVYRIDDTIRIIDTLIRYTIRIAIRIVSFINYKYCRDRN